MRSFPTSQNVEESVFVPVCRPKGAYEDSPGQRPDLYTQIRASNGVFGSKRKFAEINLYMFETGA
jgi:hypothetical protein